MDQMITTRNARFQQWQSYLTNRAKRTRAGLFVLQGVRPLNLALERNWPIDTLVYRLQDAPLSSWAADVLGAATVPAVGMSAELIGELGDKPDQPPELLAIASTAWANLEAWNPPGADPVIVVFDRPTSPGNLGTLIRSADAFGAGGVVITGHGADPFDPQCVRASTGSIFAVPVAQATGPSDIADFVTRQAGLGVPMSVVGTDETGTVPLYGHDFTGGTVLVVGNETRGMSAAWREACDTVVSIPIGGSASSLGAPSAGAVSLYEIARQRRG
ncbi:rRNA methyltransferase [Rhodococcoides trifolii]|uniref:rRNA methyltransferase n=1 Tax=Rhodococcoides trifolii TaxID=908250 RepID=A0A917D379_9NOCA|nr:TrmH family RNA methyltransferase [Rhodococcus trifolii]GGG08098.1 rRNA methyltransferase [Rhodococcus trifolii]